MSLLLTLKNLARQNSILMNYQNNYMIHKIIKKSNDYLSSNLLQHCVIFRLYLTYFRNVENGDNGPSGGSIFIGLKIFKHIYCLYFFADTLYGLSILSKILQYKYVDVNIVGVFVKAEITSILILFIIKFTYLNTSLFNKEIVYHIIHDLGPPRRYLKRLSSEIRKAKYHDILMIRDRTRTNFEKAIAF